MSAALGDEEINQLRRIDQAARAFADTEPTITKRSREAYDALMRALYDGRPGQETEPTLSERMRDAGFKSRRRAAIPDEPEGETGPGQRLCPTCKTNWISGDEQCDH